jgi:hypothetical protein
MKSRNCAGGIEGVMEKGDVEVAMNGQQAKDAITLAPNGNLEERMQANVEVGETSITSNVCRIKIELQRTIDMIEDQKIVIPR